MVCGNIGCARSGVLWKDDAQAVDAFTSKFYSCRPRTVVRIIYRQNKY